MISISNLKFDSNSKHIGTTVKCLLVAEAIKTVRARNKLKLRDKNMKINREWHGKNKMPKNPTLQQRIDWHLKHSKNCSCRPIPEKLLLEIRVIEK